MKSYSNKLVYSYKNRIYEELPFNNYLIKKEIIKDGVTIIYINKNINVFYHILIFIILLLPLIYICNYFNNFNHNKVTNIIKIPNEIYYNKENSIIDLDITNSIDNNSIVIVSLLDSNDNIIIDSMLLDTNETLGGIRVDYKFDSLPVSCKVKYNIIVSSTIIKTVYKDVLLIDSINLNNNLNNDF